MPARRPEAIIGGSEMSDEHQFIDLENFNIGDNLTEKETSPKSVMKSKVKNSVISRHIFRRCYSESKLFDIMPREVKDGDCIHVMSGGDIDALSFLIWVLRKQKIKHLLFSTWVMAKVDAEKLIEYQKAGEIKTIDAYLGEIFKSTHYGIYEFLKNNLKGKLVIFKNHSKSFIGVGEKFDFAITSSANINTNPRVENTNIFIGTNVMNFYKEFYEGINSFEKE